MKKAILPLIAASFTIASLIIAERNNTASEMELRPSQKIMRARAEWLKAMFENLPAGKFDEIAKDADSLSVQTKQGAGNLQGERKDLTLKISTLANDAAEAARKKNGADVKAGLGEIKTACDTCHAKFRDEK